MRHEATVTVPYARGDVLSYIHSKCKVISEEYGDEGTKVVFSAPNGTYGLVRKMLEKK